MKPVTIDEVAKQFVAIFTEVCKSLNLNHTCEIEEIETEEPEYALIAINEGGQYIYIDEQEVTDETVFGRVKGKRVHYTVQHTVYDPGVRYYPDGSGEPPSTDVVDDCTCPTAYSAVEKVLSLHFQMELQNVIESMSMAAYENELPEDWDQYCEEM